MKKTILLFVHSSNQKYKFGLSYKGRYNIFMGKLQFALSVTVIKEGDSFIAFSPALDLSTVGDSYDESKKRFEEAVQIFFEEITEKGTVDQALTELGWQKQKNEYVPPMVVGSQTENFTVARFAI